MDDEVWKDIKGYEGRYQVSNMGRIRSCSNSSRSAIRILKPWSNHEGYLLVDLCKNGKVEHKRVNRLVAEAFIPNLNNLPEVGHKDECSPPTNNVATNLYWTNRKENSNTEKHIERIAHSVHDKTVPSPNKCKVELDGIVFDSIAKCAEYASVKYKTMWNWFALKTKMPQSFVDRGLKYYE